MSAFDRRIIPKHVACDAMFHHGAVLGYSARNSFPLSRTSGKDIFGLNAEAMNFRTTWGRSESQNEKHRAREHAC